MFFLIGTENVRKIDLRGFLNSSYELLFECTRKNESIVLLITIDADKNEGKKADKRL
jgi:hypothetical protein